MLTIRRGRDRGHANHGWLESFHTFSFADYHDPAHMQFRTLRVLNDDRVAADTGFPSHPHRDMEIITHVLSGQLAHRDSMGNGAVVKAGEWQYMSAGKGVLHSEMNPSATDAVHLLQIWIAPDRRGYEPRYDQKLFAETPGEWTLAVSPDGRSGSIAIRQDAFIKAAKVEPGQRLEHAVEAGRGVWLHVATGSAAVNGRELQAGDAVAVESENHVELSGITSGEVILFDLK
jgi:redox-sensitive bicupin YhaK (pirin superfamily)